MLKLTLPWPSEGEQIVLYRCEFNGGRVASAGRSGGREKGDGDDGIGAGDGPRAGGLWNLRGTGMPRGNLPRLTVTDEITRDCVP